MSLNAKPQDPRTYQSLKDPELDRYWDQAFEALYEGNPKRLKQLLQNPPALERYLNDQALKAQRVSNRIMERNPDLPFEQLQELVNEEVFSPVNRQYDPEVFQVEADDQLEKLIAEWEQMLGDWAEKYA